MAVKERGLLGHVTYIGNWWIILRCELQVLEVTVSHSGSHHSLFAQFHQSCSRRRRGPVGPLWALRAGCFVGEVLKVQWWWYMLASNSHILTDFHSNWQIGMSMLEMLRESQGNKSQNVHVRICGTHSICHNVYHHFKTCTRPQFFTSGILELLQLGFAIWSKSQLKSAIITQIMRSIVQDTILIPDAH